VPKAGTPFQREAVSPADVLNLRLEGLQRQLAPRGIQMKSESPAWSRVQGVLSRGGTDVTPALTDAGKTSLAGWRQAAGKYRLDLDGYDRAWEKEKPLPWNFIDLAGEPG
jgi:hypothetical protein